MTKIVILLTLLSLALLYAQKNPAIVDKILYYQPCGEPRLYKVGSIDPKFNFSPRDVEDATTKAVGIWNTAYGKTLFKEDSTALLTVNLVYDERQQLRTQVDQQKDKVDAAQENLDAQISDYEFRVADYKKRAATLNAQIESWNKKGGAPTNVYNELSREIESMRAEAQSLNAEAQRLNAQAQKVGKSVDSFNSTVDNYNAVLETKPEEGLYNPNENTITIYVTGSKDELESTLAHEFGHALNMEHVQDKNAIMYAYANANLVPTPADMTELDNVCQPVNRLDIAAEYLRNGLSRINSL